MAAFKAGKKDVLIATDVAARGIDVDDVTHVINHTIPDDDKTYLHRAGRTGRAGKTGIAVTFVDWDDLHKWALINRALEFGQPEPVETYSSSPHLFTDLDIPAGTKGRLDHGRRRTPDRARPSRPAPRLPRPRAIRRAPRASPQPLARRPARRRASGRPSTDGGRDRESAPASTGTAPDGKAPRAHGGRHAAPHDGQRQRSTTTASAAPDAPSSSSPRLRARRLRPPAPDAPQSERRLRRRPGRCRSPAAMIRATIVVARGVLARLVGLAESVVVARPGHDEVVLGRELVAGSRLPASVFSRWSISKPAEPGVRRAARAARPGISARGRRVLGCAMIGTPPAAHDEPHGGRAGRGRSAPRSSPRAGAGCRRTPRRGRARCPRATSASAMCGRPMVAPSAGLGERRRPR